MMAPPASLPLATGRAAERTLCQSRAIHRGGFCCQLRDRCVAPRLRRGRVLEAHTLRWWNAWAGVWATNLSASTGAVGQRDADADCPALSALSSGAGRMCLALRHGHDEGKMAWW